MRTTQELSEEHQAVLAALEIMKPMEDAVAAGTPGAADDLEAMLDFFRGFVDGCHHAKEEEILFPEMEQRGLPHESGPIGVMLAEHDSGRGHVRGIGEALARIRRGDAGGVAQMRREADAYRDLLRAHIEKEEQVLFPMADQMIGSDAAEHVRERFEAIERDRVGEGRHRAYHALLDRLRRQYGGSERSSG